MNRLFQKLEHPALTDITINSSNAIVKDMMPNPLPDLYVGEPITIALKVSSLPPFIMIRGKQGETFWETKQSLADSQSRSGIAVYWARQKIAQLMDHYRRNENKSLLRQQILDVALKHHLVSRYTSLVAVDVTPVRPETHQLHTHPFKTNLPHGMQYEKIFGWPQTATPGTLYLLSGIFILWIALLWSRQHLAHQ
jgi:Ca-activated chloride channel family protein